MMTRVLVLADGMSREAAVERLQSPALRAVCLDRSDVEAAISEESRYRPSDFLAW